MVGQTTRRLALFAVAQILLAGGCAIPVASLPTRVELGGGTATGTIADSDRNTDQNYDGAKLFRFRAGLGPMQAFSRLAERRVEGSVGYLYERISPDGRGFGHHGFFAEGGYLPWRSRDRHWRLGLSGSGTVLVPSFSDGYRGDWGADIGTLIEWRNFVSSSGAKGSGGMGGSALAAGAAYGEWGYGLSTSIAYRNVDGEGYLTFVAALSVRLPLAAALVGIGK